MWAAARISYSVCNRWKVSVDRPQVRNYQSIPVPPLPHVDVRRARQHLAGVPVIIVQRQNSWHSCSAMKSVVLCSQVSSLCRTSLWNNSFTLAAAQYGHNQSCHQPAVQTQAEELYSYENHGESIQGPSAQCTTPFCIANAVSFVSARTAFRMKVKKICCRYSILNFHLPCER